VILARFRQEGETGREQQEMEVARALLEASRRMSDGDGGNNTGGGSFSATASWNSSASELDDKTGDLPSRDSLIGGWGKRTRTQSEGESGGGSNMSSWLTGLGSMRERANSGPGSQMSVSTSWQGAFLAPRVRRSSSKDVEEAMAGGLCKTAIFMPPM